MFGLARHDRIGKGDRNQFTLTGDGMLLQSASADSQASSGEDRSNSPDNAASTSTNSLLRLRDQFNRPIINAAEFLVLEQPPLQSGSQIVRRITIELETLNLDIHTPAAGHVISAAETPI